MLKCSLDLRIGGVFHYGMESPNGQVMWGKWTFVEIVPPERLVVIVAFSDADGGITVHPMSATWPRETRSVSTFTEKDGKTTLHLEWTAYHATPEEQATFDAAHDSMAQGWGGTMDALNTYLKKQQHHAAKSSGETP